MNNGDRSLGRSASWARIALFSLKPAYCAGSARTGLFAWGANRRMKKMTDKQIQQSVFAALEPQIGSTEIGVAVQDGVVTLCGTIDTHRQRDFAGQAARQVYGVRAVVNDLRVVPTVIGRLSDMQIALEAVWALEAQNTVVPTKRLQMTVRDGWITVEGEVDTPDQREVAEAVLLCQPGVRGITDLIAVQPQVIPVEVQYEIE